MFTCSNTDQWDLNNYKTKYNCFVRYNNEILFGKYSFGKVEFGSVIISVNKKNLKICGEQCAFSLTSSYNSMEIRTLDEKKIDFTSINYPAVLYSYTDNEGPGQTIKSVFSKDFGLYELYSSSDALVRIQLKKTNFTTPKDPEIKAEAKTNQNSNSNSNESNEKAEIKLDDEMNKRLRKLLNSTIMNPSGYPTFSSIWPEIFENLKYFLKLVNVTTEPTQDMIQKTYNELERRYNEMTVFDRFSYHIETSETLFKKNEKGLENVRRFTATVVIKGEYYENNSRFGGYGKLRTRGFNRYLIYIYNKDDNKLRLINIE